MERRNGTERQREWVLNFFNDPQNLNLAYRKFAIQTLGMFLGDNPSSEQLVMKDQLMELFGEIENARQFNETYLGHMLSEACTPAMWAHMQAIRLGSNTVAAEVSKMETAIEPKAIRFLFDIVGYDKEKASGTFTSGGSMAAFTALAVARKKMQAQYEIPDKEGNTHSTPEPLFVFTTPMVHYCFDKALDYLGGQNRQIKKVPVATKDLRMSPDDLMDKIINLQDKGTAMAIYAIAGETETGLVDPLGEIADVVEEVKSKFGIKIFTIADAAYGAPYRWSAVKNLFTDLPRYDAVIIDGHKALYTPYPNGAVLFKDAHDHALFGLGVKTPYLYREPKGKKSFEEQVEDLANKFLYHTDDYSLRLKRPEGSGSAGSILSTDAVRRVLGEKGLNDVLDITLDRINYLYDRLNKSKFVFPFHKPDVNVLCFTLRPELEEKLNFPSNETKRNVARTDFIEAVRAKINTDGDNKWIEGKGGFYFSSTDLPLDEIDEEATKESKEEVRKRHWVLRSVLMNPRTTNTILDQAVDRLDEIIKNEIPIYLSKHS